MGAVADCGAEVSLRRQAAAAAAASFVAVAGVMGSGAAFQVFGAAYDEAAAWSMAAIVLGGGLVGGLAVGHVVEQWGRRGRGVDHVEVFGRTHGSGAGAGAAVRTDSRPEGGYLRAGDVDIEVEDNRGPRSE